MKRFTLLCCILCCFIISHSSLCIAQEAKKATTKKATVPTPAKQETPWQDTFIVDKKNLGPTGTNPYFPLAPGYQQVFQNDKTILTRTILKKTHFADGVTVRVIEDKEEENGQLVEISYDYYAIDTITWNVYYFGENVDNYINGRIENNGGSWLAGIKQAQFGLMIPGKIKVGDKFYQELAPEIALDRAEIVAVGETVKTPAGTFTKCIKVEETSALEKNAKDYKWYAPGVGIVKDNDMVLTKINRPSILKDK
ncbi:MAG: hypothetical protein ACE14V_02665 [bacterium]